MDAFDWGPAVVAVLGLTAVGTRLLAWCLARRRLLLILARVIERLAGSEVKRTIEVQTLNAPRRVRALGEALAARAEAEARYVGSATKRRRRSKIGRFLGEVLRWLPIVGAVL